MLLELEAETRRREINQFTKLSTLIHACKSLMKLYFQLSSMMRENGIKNAMKVITMQLDRGSLFC